MSTDGTIRVQRLAPDRLSGEVWTFGFGFSISLQSRVRLRSYERVTRASTRHKWRLDTGALSWSFTDNRRYAGFGLPSDQVPHPADVEAEALEKARAMITVEWPT